MIEIYGAVAFLAVGFAILMTLLFAREATSDVRPAAAFGMAIAGFSIATLSLAAALSHVRAWTSFRVLVTVLAAVCFAAGGAILLMRLRGERAGRWRYWLFAMVGFAILWMVFYRFLWSWPFVGLYISAGGFVAGFGRLATRGARALGSFALALVVLSPWLLLRRLRSRSATAWRAVASLALVGAMLGLGCLWNVSCRKEITYHGLPAGKRIAEIKGRLRTGMLRPKVRTVLESEGMKVGEDKQGVIGARLDCDQRASTRPPIVIGSIRVSATFDKDGHLERVRVEEGLTGP